jgi:SAM-dependent methyltransferase
MSTPRTGAAQLARLAALGLTVELLPPLRDIDEPADAEYVADRHPELRFSRRYAEIVAGRRRQPADRLFDELYAGGPVSSSTRSRSPDRFEAGLARWAAPADSVDSMVVSRCVAPVIDLGCGPGRIVGALQRSGRAVLGVDISRTAVALATREGGQILRRDVADELPGEGRWGTALLLDGNIGIGGDVVALLDRCRKLVGPGGLIICELDPDPERADRAELVLAGAANRSAELPWSRIGLRRVQCVAGALDLIMVEEWRAGGRAFVTLRTAG